MKLEINLTDREEIAAAVPLLQMILQGTEGATTGRTPTEAPEFQNFPMPRSAEVVEESSADRDSHEGLIADGYPPAHPNFPCVIAPVAETAGYSQFVEVSAAAIFGGAAAPLPLIPSPPSVQPSAGIAPPPPAAIAPPPANPGPALSAPPATPAAVELDTRGFPWDSRIHSSTKNKLANGQWKNARGKAPEQVAQVEAELARASQPSTYTENAQAAVAVLPSLIAEAAASMPIIPPADPTTFEQFMPRITAAVTTGAMPIAAVGAACAAQGLASIVALQQNPQFVPLVWSALKLEFPGLA